MSKCFKLNVLLLVELIMVQGMLTGLHQGTSGQWRIGCKLQFQNRQIIQNLVKQKCVRCTVTLKYLHNKEMF